MTESLDTVRKEKSLGQIVRKARYYWFHSKETLILEGALGILFGGFVTVSAYGLLRLPQIRDQEACIQLAGQRQFSPNLCSDACFRESYFELQRKYKVEDLDLVYRIAIRRCEEK